MKVKHAGNATDEHFSLQAGVNKLTKGRGGVASKLVLQYFEKLAMFLTI